MFYQLACAVGCACSWTAGAAQTEMAACNKFVRPITPSKTAATSRTAPPSRTLCFPSDGACAGRGNLSAKAVWENSSNPAELMAELMDSSDWTGSVSEVEMPSKHGTLVRIARVVGTAHCVRDTYLLRQDNRYRAIHSDSLDRLSAEAGNCGDGKVTFSQFRGAPLLVTAFYGSITGYRFASNFDLREVCSIAYRAAYGER